MRPGEASRAYVDAPVTDLDAATRAARHAAAHWGLSEPQLLRVGMNAIFGADDVVLRVSAPTVDAVASLDLLEYLGRNGVRVPIPARDEAVRHGELSITGWQRIRPTAAPIDWRGVGTMVRTVHDLDPAELPRSVPLPTPVSFPWWDFDTLLEQVAELIDAPARLGLVTTVERHRGWQDLDGAVVCHGDVHPGNVMMTAAGPVLIDWDLLCWAPPGWDHGPMITWATRWGGDPGDYEAFADGYGRSLADDETTLAFAELRLVAATLLRLAAARRDPAAMPEAQRRLAYWRGDADAPRWTAQ
jgi:hypothetical protein